VTATFPRKIAALRAHESQIRQMEDLTERLRARLALTGQLAGLPEGRLAESFRVLDTA
jgi:LmbE family N-acetylglucosaminyl deacetylase